MRKIRFSIRLFIFAMILLLCMQINCFAATGKCTAENVRIRESASTSGEVIDVLSEGDQVQILGEEGDWYKVSANGNTGYASKQFITSSEETSNTETPVENNENNNQNIDNTQDNNIQDKNTQTDKTTVVNKVYKVTEDAQVYILPVLNAEVIGQVKVNENVTLLNSAGLWVYIQTSNISGWVRIDKLSTEGVETTQEVPAESETETQEPEKVEEEKPAEKEKSADENKTAETYTEKTMYVKATTINVRSESNTNSNVVCSADINTEVKVVGEENGWYKVEVNGKSGYIRNDLLSDKQTEVSTRSNDLDRAAAAQNAAKTEEPVATPAAASQPAQSSNGVTGTDIVNYAQQFLGCRYVYGASGPSSFDCSGFTMYVYKHFGYSLSHSSKTQATQGRAVTGDLQAGDILVFKNGSSIGHVGIYIGNDKFIHASDSTTGVIISNLHDSWNISKYVGARRIL